MEKIYLWNENEIPLFNKEHPECLPNLTPFIKEGAKAAVVLCPGGAYQMKAYDTEGYPIAEYLNDCGLTVFMLDYRIKPYKYPVELIDIKRAIRYVRHNAEKYGIDKDKIGVAGFSAGGHLAGMALTSPEGEASEHNLGDDIDSASSKANFGILCYPVIVSGKYENKGTFDNLCGNDEKLRIKLSLETRVTDDTAPVFIWHTANDQAVPSYNSIRFAAELAKHDIPYELHIFRDGPHGMGLAKDRPDVAAWTTLCKTFLQNMGWI